jgi:hypothetical protein
MACAPVTAVLVAGVIEGGDIGDYAVYVGCGDKSHADDIALHGQKISYDEACAQFPIGLERNRYRP